MPDNCFHDREGTSSGLGTMKSVLLVISLALLVNTSFAAVACDSKGRSCVVGQAECINGKCVCQPPYVRGDGAFACYEENTATAEVFNDPVLANFNNESIPFPYPCRYLTTHVIQDLWDSNKNVIGTCEFMLHSFNAKNRGKFFLHGFDVALRLSYKNGKKVKLSSRHYGVAKYGVLNLKNMGTIGQFYQSGPWGNDDVTYTDDENGVYVDVSRKDENNQLLFEIKSCGIRVTFVPYDIKDKRAQVTEPGMSVAIKEDHKPRWLSNDEVMALAPHTEGGATFADKQITHLTVEESAFVRAFSTKYIQNMPMKDKGKCDATHKAFKKCTLPEVRKAVQNCYWMLTRPRFMYCMDKSKSSRNILRLFSVCVKVWCGTKHCDAVIDLIYKAGCHTVGDIPELPHFMTGAMCPTT